MASLPGNVWTSVTRWSISVAAMTTGKHAATEVPAAYTVDDCWALVEKSEKTGIPCMMLENACLSRRFLAVYRLIRAGLLGDIYHCQAGYNHDVRYVKFNTRFEDDGTLYWRGWHSVHRDGNLYPTHQLGPIALIMNVNRGTKFDYLVSMSTPSHGLNNYAAARWGKDHPNALRAYKNGDVNTALIKLADGNTITLYHDTQSWRPRDDMHLYQGTKGAVHSTLERIFSTERHWDGKKTDEWEWHDLQPFIEEFDHPMWKLMDQQASQHGHGGTDYMTLRGFIEAARFKTQTPQTVYDAASWSVVGPLTEESVANKSRPVDFPDFTKGMWKNTPPWELQWQWT